MQASHKHLSVCHFSFSLPSLSSSQIAQLVLLCFALFACADPTALNHDPGFEGQQIPTVAKDQQINDLGSSVDDLAFFSYHPRGDIITSLRYMGVPESTINLNFEEEKTIAFDVKYDNDEGAIYLKGSQDQVGIISLQESSIIGFQFSSDPFPYNLPGASVIGVRIGTYESLQPLIAKSPLDFYLRSNRYLESNIRASDQFEIGNPEVIINFRTDKLENTLQIQLAKFELSYWIIHQIFTDQTLVDTRTKTILYFDYLNDERIESDTYNLRYEPIFSPRTITTNIGDMATAPVKFNLPATEKPCSTGLPCDATFTLSHRMTDNDQFVSLRLSGRFFAQPKHEPDQYDYFIAGIYDVQSRWNHKLPKTLEDLQGEKEKWSWIDQNYLEISPELHLWSIFISQAGAAPPMDCGCEMETH